MRRKNLIIFIASAAVISTVLISCGGVSQLNGKWMVSSLDSSDEMKEKYKDGVDKSNTGTALIDFVGALGISYIFREGKTIEFEGDKAYLAGVSTKYETYGNKLEFKDLDDSGSSATVFDYSINGNTLQLTYNDSFIITLDKM